MASKQDYVRRNAQHEAVARLALWYTGRWGSLKTAQWERMACHRPYSAENLINLQTECLRDPSTAQVVLATIGTPVYTRNAIPRIYKLSKNR